MELCDGTLQTYLNCLQTAMVDIDGMEIVEIMIQVLSGLCLCHKRGVVHRDLKLSNGTCFQAFHNDSPVLKRVVRLPPRLLSQETMASQRFRVLNPF